MLARRIVEARAHAHERNDAATRSAHELWTASKLFAVLALAASALPISGCGDDDDDATTAADGSAILDGGTSTGLDASTSISTVSDGSTTILPDAAPSNSDASTSTGVDSSVTAERPVYAVSTSRWTPDGTASSFLILVDSLGAGPAIDLGKAVEFGGGARAYGPEQGNVVYVSSDEDGTLTEVTFDRDTPRIGRKVSFANLGITGTTGGNVHLFVSPTKAYFVSQDTLEIVVWNPQAMEVVKSIPLNLQTDPRTDYVAFYPRPIVIGNQLVLVSNEHDEETVGLRAQVSVVDLTEDRVVSTTVETRCHGMVKSAVDARGDRYFASGSASAALHFVAPAKSLAPCMLRMRAGATGFDPQWSRSLTEALGTSLWTGVTPGKSGTLYVQSIAENAPEVVAGAMAMDHIEVATAEPWSWYALSDGDAAPVSVTTDLTTPPEFAPVPVGDSAYVSVWDSVNTTLVDLTSGQTPQKGLVVPGFVYNVVRIR